MDIGSLPNNKFYKGFESEEEVILYLNKQPNQAIHIWRGYFDDIFENAPVDGKAWSGFTRDYQQDERTFAGENSPVDVNISEYLDDLKQYTSINFTYPETHDCLELLLKVLEYAHSKNLSITVMIL